MTENKPVEYDISCRALKSLLVFFKEQYGVDKLGAALAQANFSAHIDVAFLENEENWVTLANAQTLIDVLSAASENKSFARLAGQRTASREVIGRSFSYVKTFGTVSACYRQLIQASRLYNRAGEFAFRRLGLRAVEIKYRPREREPNRHFCELRMGQFESFPTVWGMPLARAEEIHCQVDGAQECCYVFKWVEPPSRFATFISGSLAVLVAAVAGLSLPIFDTLPMLRVILVLGAMVGVITSCLRILRVQSTMLRDLGIDFFNSTNQLQQQFAEIQMLNTTLEGRVERRTIDLRVATEKLQQSLNREQELAAVKSNFIANVSHELRTPLTLILGPLEELMRQSPSAEVTRSLETMRNNGRVLLRHVNMLLDYATVEAGAARVNLSDSNLGALVNEWVENALPQAQQLDLALSVEGVEDIPDTQFDHEKIETVFANLLANALKFTPPGGKVICRAYVKDQSVVAEVQDTGRGISAEDAAHIFDRFYQAKDGAPKPAGTGIGLTLAKEYAEMHGGKLTVESTVGEGSVFRLQIPQGPAIVERRRQARRREDRSLRAFDESGAHTAEQRRRALLATAGLQRQTVQPIATNKPVPEAPPDAARILLVEDHFELRQHMVSALSRHYRVESASNGVVAQQLAHASPPDVIVSDVQMPEMDGFELCRRLREDSALSGVPFIFVTATGGSEQVVNGLQSGAVDYVVKPFDMRELIARIEAQLRARRALLTLDERNSRLAAIGQSVTSIAHDLRSPLQAIKGHAELSMRWVGQIEKLSPDEGGVFAEMKDDLSAIMDAVSHSQNMTNKVLDFVRSGAETFDKRPTHLGYLIKHIAKNMMLELHGVGTELVVDIPDDDDLTLPIDTLHMRRALENLLRNAREAVSTAKNTQRKKIIRIQSHSAGSSIVIRVADSGDGISEEVRERLFQPFASAGKVNGLGLGLSVVWNVVMAHDGTISAANAPVEGGTVFEMVLPRVPVKAVGSVDPAMRKP